MGSLERRKLGRIVGPHVGFVAGEQDGDDDGCDVGVLDG